MRNIRFFLVASLFALSTQETIIAVTPPEITCPVNLVQALQRNAAVTCIERDNQQYSITLSDGQTIQAQAATVTCQADNQWFVNGRALPASQTDLNITRGKKGHWYINGIDSQIKIDAAQTRQLVAIANLTSSLVFYFSDNSIININKSTAAHGNILYGKKWAVVGDSFSAGDFRFYEGGDERFGSGPYKGQYKVYSRHISMRNNMVLQEMFKGGRTLAVPSKGNNGFANATSETPNSCYTQIDEDVDYITIYLGINDSHHRPKSTGSDGEDQRGIITLGTISDETIHTFYGAWNIVLRWIIKNRPYAKVGIIVSNGCETDEYRQASIAIARKWGIPYIDLNGDERTPTMLRSSNPDLCDEAKKMRFEAQKVFKKNGHPNLEAHRLESTIIENFLRSL